MAGKREALIASAEKSLQKGRPDAALKDYLKVLEETPGDINILNKVGDLFVRLNRNDESIPYFSRIAEHYSKDGFFLKAIAIYKKINKLDPARLDVYERLAELYGKQGLGMEAKSQYQVLADHYVKQDNLAGALAIVQKMVGTEPGNIQLHVKLADLFTQARRVPDALREYGVVAGMLRERGAVDESIQVFEKALRIAPDNLEILKTFVPTLAEAGRHDEAKACLRKALETTPRSVPLFILAAETALARNDMAEARSFVSKAQSVEPESEDVLSTVVRIHLKGRRPDLAYSSALPLADQAVKRGEAKKALNVLIPIAKASPDNEELLRKIVEIASASGDEHAGLPFRSALAELWRKQGKLEEAADALRHCSRIAPDVPEFRARLSQLEAVLPPPTMPSLESGSISLQGVELKAPRGPSAPATVMPEAREANEFEFELPEEELVEKVSPTDATPIPGTLRPILPEHKLVAMPQPTIPDSPYKPHPATSADALDQTDPGRHHGHEAPEGAEWRGYEAPSQSAAEALARFGASEAGHYVPEPMVPPSPASDFDEAEELPEELPQSAELDVAPGGTFDEPEPAVPLPPPQALGATRAAEKIEIADEIEVIDEIEVAPPAAVEPPRAALPAPPRKPVEPPAPVEPRRVAEPPKPVEPPKLERPRRGPLTPAPTALQPADSQIEEGLVEAEVFRKYGLLEKAVDQLKTLARRQPDAIRVREKLFELYLEQGKKTAARREAEVLKERYRTEGKDDRIKAIDALIGESAEPATPPPGVKERDLTAELRVTSSVSLKPVKPAEIDIPLPVAEPRTPEKPKPAPEPAPSFFVPEPAAPPEAPILEIPPPALQPPAAPEIEISFEELDTVEPSFTAPVPAPPVAPPPATPPTPLEFAISPEEEAAFLPVHAPEPAVPGPAPVPEAVAEVEAPPAPEPPAPVFEVEPVAEVWPVAPPRPSPDDLAEIDFCLEQGMVVDAAERLQTLEAQFPGDPEVRARRQHLEGVKGPSEEGRPALHDILSDDLESVLDAELGRALTNEMAQSAPAHPAPPKHAGGESVDESGLFSDEQEFFNFAEELQTEMKQEAAPVEAAGGEVSLEEIFKEFKKGVEQQLSPEDYETHYNLGIAYKEMGLTDEAIGEFQLASKDPLHAVECCAMLGLCFLEKGLPQLSIKWYRKGLETMSIREDDRLGLLYDLGNVFSDVGDRDNAYKTFLEIYGSNANYRDVGEKLRELAPA